MFDKELLEVESCPTGGAAIDESRRKRDPKTRRRGKRKLDSATMNTD
jgi:hypothetical protein